MAVRFWLMDRGVSNSVSSIRWFFYLGILLFIDILRWGSQICDTLKWICLGILVVIISFFFRNLGAVFC